MVQFEFTTPLASKVNRKTIAKSFFKDNVLYTVWVSALTNIFEAEGGYGNTLVGLKILFSSCTLIDSLTKKDSIIVNFV